MTIETKTKEPQAAGEAAEHKALDAERARSLEFERRANDTETKLKDAIAAAERVALERDAERDRADKADAVLVARSLDALIGTKILPAEKPGLVALAKSDRGAFDAHIAALRERPDLGVLDPNPLPRERVAPTSPTGAGADVGTQLFSLLNAS